MIEGESFLATRAGTKVAASCVTLSDDAHHPLSIGIGFDFEGVPRKCVDVIEGGTARGPVTDLRTARRLGVSSTGHASGSNEFGPYASNVVMRAGDSSFEDLLAGIDQGLLVTRFHYVNVLDRSRTTLTGMTRDGTFRIEDGEITTPVRNLRFADSVLDVLSSVVAVGAESRSFGPDWGSFGSTVAPAVRAESFRFTSTTSH
jgi:predicted Zn-dependent protease